ncbi:hypothetical protein TNCV_1260311 [Trichonephila clavipes]|uniref:Uncharacterized protein n=1 Tax=Trichonephila clavipes TaxID=2585209 RepID=A0A8X6RC92_TRICX|nr:hypothetical protein TNCV_1260311 [Trichonephila clavipes]
MFDSSKPDDDVVNFVSKLKSHMQSLHPKPPKHHGKRPVLPIQDCWKQHMFFFDETCYVVHFNNPMMALSKCKPAFFLNTEDLQLPQTKNETPATVEPNATASTPATVESDPTVATPTQPSTRSGRKVHLPTRGCDLPNPSSSALSHSEIHTLHRAKTNLTWRNPFAHFWYAAKSLGLSLQCPKSRGFQTALGTLEAVTCVVRPLCRRLSLSLSVFSPCFSCLSSELLGHFPGTVVLRSRPGLRHSFAERPNGLGVGFPAPRGFETATD